MPSPDGSPITIVIPRDKGSKPPKSSGFWSSISGFWSSIKRYWGQYLFFFLGGVGVGLHVSVAKLGVIVALGAASHGIFIGLVVALAVGLIVTGFLFALTRYLLERFVTYLVTNTIESNIKSALRDNDPEKTNLKFWLAKAQNPRGTFNENCWKYKFSDGRSLVTYALDDSDIQYDIYKKPTWYQKRSRNQHLHTSQSYLKGILLTEHVYSKSLNSVNPLEPVKSESNPARPRPAPPKLKWYQKLLLWFKELLDISWQFNNENFYEGSQERFPALARTPVNSSLVPNLQNNTQNQQPLPSPTPLDTKDIKHTKHNNDKKEGDKKEDKKTEKQPGTISAPPATNAKSSSIPNRPTTTAQDKTDKTKRNIINETPIRERYTPQQILRTRAIIQDMMTPDNAAKANAIAGPQSLEAKPEKLPPSNTAAIPAHLQHWVKRISLQHQLERSHQRQIVQAVERKVNVTTDLAQTLSANGNVSWDESKELPFSEVEKRMHETKHASTAFWLDELSDAIQVHLSDYLDKNRHVDPIGLSNLRDSIELKKIIFITKQAQDILLQGRDLRGHVSLQSLPLGFRPDWKKDRTGKIIKFVLSYDEKLREEQLANPEKNHTAIRFDPASELPLQQKNNSTSSEKFISQATLQRILTDKAITLTSKQEDFLNKLDKDNTDLYYCSIMDTPYGSHRGGSHRQLKYRTFDALKEFAETFPAPHFLNFIDALNSLYQCPLNWLNQGGFPIRTPTLLHLFISYYLMAITDVFEFNTQSQIADLQRLATLPIKHLEWFIMLSETSWRGKGFEGSMYQSRFKESIKGLYFILDFFAQKKLPLPDPSVLSSFGGPAGFVQLAGIINCITLAGQKGRKMLELQANFTAYIPHKNIELAESQLRAGYSFVHQAMCFDTNSFLTFIEGDWFFPLDPDRHITMDDDTRVFRRTLELELHKKLTTQLFITPEEFADLSYPTAQDDQHVGIYACYCRTLFLRYVALHVAPDHVEEALKMWTDATRDYSFDRFDKLYPPNPSEKVDASNNTPISKLNRLHGLLSKNWNKIRDKVCALPTKMALLEKEGKATAIITDAKQNSSSDIFTLNQQDRNKPDYSERDTRKLFNRLHLDEAVSSKLKRQIRTLNELSTHYSQMTHVQLANALKNARTLREAKEEKTEVAAPIIHWLAMLREAHYRFTYSDSNSDPRQGEWLRLEQIAAILIAMHDSSLIQLETSEGKTVIIQMIALLKALQGERVDVLTHNEVLADLAADKLRRLAQLLGLKIAKKNEPVQDILAANIFYCDISEAVINERLASIPKDFQSATPLSKQDEEQEKKHEETGSHPADRLASAVLVDEADNVLIDSYGRTRIQVSNQATEADKELEAFLRILNHTVREELQKDEYQKSTPAQQLQIIQNALANDAYHNKNHSENPNKLSDWLSAAITAMQQKENEDYVIEPEDADDPTNDREVVHIVLKDTTGRVDKISQWSEGIHQCVSAWEKHQNNHTRMKIPGVSEVIAEGDIASYLQRPNYRTRCGFTGTLGEEAVRTQMEKILGTHTTVVMPRAKRPIPPNAPWTWPLENNGRGDRLSPVFDDAKLIASIDDEKEQKELYTRAYHFRPTLVQNKTTHFAKLLETVQRIQAADQSVIIFFNTIDECNKFSEHLRNANIKSEKIQILDDTRDKPSAANEQKFRPPEATVIERAKNPQMITLTTAAGSRGTDFDDITVGILAKPGLNRVTAQKAGRIGRNGQFGMVYKIYCIEDLHPDAVKKFFPELANKAEEKVRLNQALPHSAFATQRQALSTMPLAKGAKESEEKMRDDAPSKADIQSPIDLHEQKSQAVDLESIRDKEAQRAYSQDCQARFFQLPSTTRRELDAKWPQFFQENKGKPMDEKAWDAFLSRTPCSPR